MEFRIAHKFTESLARLTGQEQKAVKTTAFDLQINLDKPGMQFHKLDKAKDPNFWSVRVDSDIRIIVHKTGSSQLLCYVDHHDNAYNWAERRKLETHPKTGAAQLVEIRETIKEITVPKYVPKPPLFSNISEDDLLSYGVPSEWLDDVRRADEDTVFEVAEHLPSEAADALLNLATGTSPQAIQPAACPEDPFEHPDAQRRFRVMHNVEELERALEYPWENRFDLTQCLECFDSACIEKYGERERLTELENELRPIRNGDPLTYELLETLLDDKYWHYSRYRYLPPKDKIEAQLTDVQPELSRLPDREASMIPMLVDIFKDIEIASILLRFVYPEHYGIHSPPVTAISETPKALNHANEYHMYLKKLRYLQKKYHLLRAADADMALWSLAEKSKKGNCKKGNKEVCRNYKAYLSERPFVDSGDYQCHPKIAK